MSGEVFGYGSLVAAVPGAVPATLHGARRAWTVAMDNGLDLAGYKHYVADDGSRPAVCVAFLDLVVDAGSEVDGVLRPVGPDELAVLDRRERQYVRVDVTDRVPGATGRVWTYVGRGDSRARATTAREAGTLVVVRSYVDAVHAAFDALGGDAPARYAASTDAPGVPVLDLRRIDQA